MQSVKKAKRPTGFRTLETKLKIIADFEAGKQAVIRNVEPDLQCYKDVLTEMKKPRIQPTIKPFFKKMDNFTFLFF
jgi:hypothetical protein